MRYVGKLVEIVRERTKNLDFKIDAVTGVTTSGISTNLILEYFNQAQSHLQAILLNVMPNSFIAQKIINCVAEQEEYSIPDHLFADNKIVAVEYSGSNTTLDDFYPLDQGTIRDRRTHKGTPLFYILRSGRILLNPIPQSSAGRVRVSYYRELDGLDIRRGQVSAVTIASGEITALSVTTGTADAFELPDAQYICICDKYGTVKTYNIAITNYNSGTGAFTLDGNHTLATGETAAVGDYVTINQYSTTHSKLPHNCERYLMLYAQKRLLTTDESDTSVEEDAELRTIEADILNTFAEETRDIRFIPIVDEEIMF